MLSHLGGLPVLLSALVNAHVQHLQLLMQQAEVQIWTKGCIIWCYWLLLRALLPIPG